MSEDHKDLGDKAEEAFDKAKEKAHAMGEEAKEAAGEFKEEAKKTAREFKEGLESAGGDNKKILAGILAIFFGSIGIHKFILGYQKEGLVLLLLTIVGWLTACFVVGYFILMATWVIGVIEGIIYLTKSDEEFYNTYQVGRKPWF